MWSIGLVLYYMAYGKLPWKNANIPTPEGRAALIQEILSFTEYVFQQFQHFVGD